MAGKFYVDRAQVIAARELRKGARAILQHRRELADYRVLAAQILNSLAREPAFSRSSSVPEEEPLGSDDLFDLDKRIRILYGAMKALSPVARRAVFLRCEKGLSFAQIAVKLRISFDEVKDQLTHAAWVLAGNDGDPPVHLWPPRGRRS